MIKVAINGAGRIGRAFLKLALSEAEVEVVAMNDLCDVENIIYLLKYDTAYGRSDFLPILAKDKKSISIYDKEIKYFSEKDPAILPWKDLEVDVVVESTGAFTTFKKAGLHIKSGAKRVVITAPVKEEPADVTEATILMGINEEKFETCIVTSNASCTTNAASPLIQILNEKLGIEKAILNTVHGYTASQSIVDGPNKKDWKEGRAAAQNIVPTSTGAAIAVTEAIPELEGKFDGISMRVPIVAGSIADITFISKKETTVKEINEILKDAAKEDRWQGIFTVTEDQIVSSDIVGSLYGSIADLGLTRVVGGNLVKVCAWYDNEMGYSNTLLRHVLEIGKYLK
ncbi:MAG TPA: glyceraldehyde 3-phosphate dehydrogenase NAD-binding domain-containing protein [Candidatus Paceibacterota bacterium]